MYTKFIHDAEYVLFSLYFWLYVYLQDFLPVRNYEGARTSILIFFFFFFSNVSDVRIKILVCLKDGFIRRSLDVPDFPHSASTD